METKAVGGACVRLHNGRGCLRPTEGEEEHMRLLKGDGQTLRMYGGLNATLLMGFSFPFKMTAIAARHGLVLLPVIYVRVPSSQSSLNIGSP